MANQRHPPHRTAHQQSHPAPAKADAPSQQAAPPQPHPVVILKILKNAYNGWIAAGGTPPIYGNTPPAIPPTITPP